MGKLPSGVAHASAVAGQGELLEVSRLLGLRGIPLVFAATAAPLAALPVGTPTQR